MPYLALFFWKTCRQAVLEEEEEEKSIQLHSADSVVLGLLAFKEHCC